jgi:hypothetical protein
MLSWSLSQHLGDDSFELVVLTEIRTTCDNTAWLQVDVPTSPYDAQQHVLAEGRIRWRAELDQIRHVEGRPDFVFTDVKNWLAYPQTDNNLPGCQGGGLALYV